MAYITSRRLPEIFSLGQTDRKGRSGVATAFCWSAELQASPLIRDRPELSQVAERPADDNLIKSSVTTDAVPNDLRLERTDYPLRIP